VDLKVVETIWKERPLSELRFSSRGGRLGSLLSEMDFDPRKTMQAHARAMHSLTAQRLYDALCEEQAAYVLYDVPHPVWRGLLPLLVPHGSGESPYPPDINNGQAVRDGLVLIAEGRLSAETAAVACSRAIYPPEDAGDAAQQGVRRQIDHRLWADVLSSLSPMLDAVRDRGHVLLIES
jgi:hypothetical protein